MTTGKPGKQSLMIEQCKESQLPALRKLFLRSRQSTFTWMDINAFHLHDLDEQAAGEEILVAVIGETIVGFISIWMADNFIHHLFVEEQHHGKGIGKALLKAAINKAGLPLTLKCLQKNTKAIAFYEHMGFTIKDKSVAGDMAWILFELNEHL